MHGKGVLKYPGAYSYDGLWRDGKRHGQGVLKQENGAMFDGEWADDKRNGKGKWAGANGDTYEGLFHHDKVKQLFCMWFFGCMLCFSASAFSVGVLFSVVAQLVVRNLERENTALRTALRTTASG